MQISIKKINNYVVKDGKNVGVYQEDNETFLRAGLIKIKNPNSLVEIALSSLYEVENPPLFLKSFWCDKKRRVVSVDSDALVADLVAQAAPDKNPWINTTQFSTPVYYADMSTPKVQIYHVQNGVPIVGSNFEKDMTQVPVDPSWMPAAGSDGHITIIDLATKKLWEFWQFARINGKCQAGWGGMISDLYNSNGVVPKVGGELRGATATSLPVSGGTMLISELESGIIPHMLAFATQNPKWAFIPPALRTDEKSNQTGIIPAGKIFQFPSNIFIDPSWTPIIKMMVTAVRDYGMIQRDRSGCVCFYAEDISYRGLGAEPYKAYYGGKALWDVIKQFPFNQLKAVEF